jgi:uncharacterized membrane protein
MLPGYGAALNHHPMFVHFPIVLWLMALMFELLAVWRRSDELQRTASRMLYLGTFAAIVTAFTGFAAQKSIPPGDALRVVGIHETLMLLSTSLALALCIFAFLTRRASGPPTRRWMLLGLLVLGILLTIGTDRGAELVYGYGAAVNWPTAQQQK